MRYWEEMLNKYGFGGGDAEPTEARWARIAYVQYINTLLRALDSKYRVYAYDRAGMHNSCMIVFTTADVIQNNTMGLAPSQDNMWVAYGTKHWLGLDTLESACSNPLSDPVVQKVIDMAHDARLDDYVAVRIKLNQAGLDKVCEAGLMALEINKSQRNT